jgi:hypothetical protein
MVIGADLAVGGITGASTAGSGAALAFAATVATAGAAGVETGVVVAAFACEYVRPDPSDVAAPMRIAAPMTQPTPMNIVRVLIVRIDRANRVRNFAYFALADFFVRFIAFTRIVFSFSNP